MLKLSANTKPCPGWLILADTVETPQTSGLVVTTAKQNTPLARATLVAGDIPSEMSPFEAVDVVYFLRENAIVIGDGNLFLKASDAIAFESSL